MTYIYVLDWLINKPVKIKLEKELDIKHWDKILYIEEEKNQKMIWIYLWYECETVKQWTFVDIIKWDKKEKFDALNDKSKELFSIFKIDFVQNFPESVPVTARMSFNWDTVYFYFYSEERFDFKVFLPKFRQKIWYSFFLFQIWARDRIRMADLNDATYWVCWQKLCCRTYKTPLPTVENENIELQNLEYRWIEKLKWRCWKLKCCLNYERDIYIKEWQAFPKKGETFKHNWCNCQCNTFNIMTGEIIWRDIESHDVIRTNISEIKNNVNDKNNIETKPVKLKINI